MLVPKFQTRFGAVLLSLFLASVPAAAQHPDQVKGFQANGVYQFNGIDNVNLFNGNLTLSVPIGQVYPAGGGLSYQFRLHSNGNLWEAEEIERDPDEWFTFAFANRNANAGIGWTLSLGRLYPIHEWTNDSVGWLYESPDGGAHPFYPTLHDGETVAPNASYTRDSSYLRMTYVPATARENDRRLIEFPDGTVHTFRPDYLNPANANEHARPWLLEKIWKRGSTGAVEITYEDRSAETKQFRKWTVRDNFRTHVVTLADYTYDSRANDPETPGWDPRKLNLTLFPYDSHYRTLVQSVELAAFGGATATYTFEYAPMDAQRPEWDTDENEQSWTEADVQTLEKLKQPDGTFFEFAYMGDGVNGQAGLPWKMVLPTGGRIEWDWYYYWLPKSQCGDPDAVHRPHGVVARKLFDRQAATPFATWTYKQEWDKSKQCSTTVPTTGPKEIVTVVTDPKSHKTRNYFSVALDDSGGFFAAEYGQPFSRLRPDETNARWLSQEIIPSGQTSGRSTYLAYERDPAPVLPGLFNSRVVSQRVVYEDGEHMDTDSSDFDGLGNYRKVTRGGSATDLITKVTTTNYNSGRGTFPGSFVILPPDHPWILNTYDTVKIDENPAPENPPDDDPDNDPEDPVEEVLVSEACFDIGAATSTGRLTRMRTYRGEGKDVVTAYGYDQNGNVESEAYSGGESSGIASGSTCSGTPATPTYEIGRSWSHGVLAKTWYDGFENDFLTLRLDIDADTGLPNASYQFHPTGTDRRTQYAYDTMGRIESITPSGSARSFYVYAAAGTGPAHVTFQQLPADAANTTPLTESHYYYDGLGRLVQQKERMADGDWSALVTTYDHDDREVSQSVAIRSGTSDYESALSGNTTETTYDGYGRPKTVEQPDGHTTTLDYAGVLSTTRTVRINSGTDDEREAETKEHYDGFGRLIRVTESPGENVDYETAYAYDAGDHLTTVTQGDQTRSFEYDLAGFLVNEDHPESAAASYTYDARGQMLTKQIGTSVSLKFDYDAAERLTSVRDVSADRLIKQFDYDETTLPTGAPVDEPGRLVKQTRWNHFDEGTYVVSDYFTFDDSGRPDRKFTTVDDPDPQRAETRFEQQLEYTDLNQPKLVHYPVCSTCGGTLPGNRGISLTYTNGFLTKVDGVTGAVDPNKPNTGITYTPAGQVHKVRHAAPHAAQGEAGVLDTFLPDGTGIARPAQITVSNAADCKLITAQSGDDTGHNGDLPRFEVTAVAGATFQWYRGRTGNPENALAGETGPSFTPSELTATSYYWCLVSGPACKQASRTFTATYCGVPVIDVPAADFAGDPTRLTQGASAELAIAVRDAASIRWNRYAAARNADGSWTRTGPATPIGGSTTSVWWTAPAYSTTGSNFYGIYATATGSCAAVVERLVKAFEVTPGCEVPSIAVPPADFTGDAVAIQESTKTTLAITTTGTATSYAWQQAPVTRSGDQWTASGTATPLAISAPSIEWTAPVVETGHALYGIYATVSGCDTTTNARLVKVFDVTPCAPPRSRSIHASPAGEITPGMRLTLAVDDDADEVAFQWYESARYDDVSKPLGITAAIGVDVTASAKFYWVRMTRSCGARTVTTDTPIFTVDPNCRASILVQPKPVTQVMPAPGVKVHSTASVIAGGVGPFTYAWYEEGSAEVIDTASSYTWTHTVTAADAPAVQKRVYVKVKPECAIEPVKSETVTLSISRTAQRIAAYNKIETVYRGSEPARLYVVMDPEPSPQSTYEYEWFRVDGAPVNLGMGSSSLNVTTSSVETYRVRITGTHSVDGKPPYKEETVSPTMYVALYGACALPPLRWAQSEGNIMDGVPDVTFFALSDWPAVRYQWYHGPAGDTRHPLTADEDKPNQFTTDSNPVVPIWVRASLACGAHRDSPTLTFTRDGCGPVLFDQHVASVDVAYGHDATLAVEPISGGTPQYFWYEGDDDDDTRPVTSAGPTPHELLLQGVRASGRYWVKVRRDDCGNSTKSFVATVRVASAPGITPPSPWQTEVWTFAGDPVDLIAQSAGATRYEWYRGDVGDTSALIANATLDRHSVNPPADENHWARVIGANGVVDSPTMTVRVCNRPELVEEPWLDQHIIAGQLTAFTIKVRGTNLSYQWYQGRTGDTSTPIGRPVDRLEVQPNVTTEYWVRVTAGCGVGTPEQRQYDSATFMASICPVVAEPVAGLSYVMPGTTTTLTIPGGDPSWRYQWYAGTVGTKTTPIANSNSASIATPPITGPTTFWCEVTSGGCSTPSAEVHVALCQEPTITWTTGDRFIARGDRVFFHAATTGTGVTKTFYAGNAGDVAGSQVVHGPSVDDFSLIVEETTKFWARATIANCYADTGNITVTVCIPKITSHPAGMGITAGQSHTLSVGTDIPAASHEWFEGEKGVTSAPVPNSNLASIIVTPTADTKYWVRVKGCGTSFVDSNAALVTVCTPPSIRSTAPSQWITRGQQVQLYVDAGGSSPSYRWYVGQSGDVSNPTGRTGASEFFQPNETTNYWVRVTNGCNIADSATITVSVCATPVIEMQPQSQAIFSGRKASFIVHATQATNTPLTYQWYRGTTPENSTLISGATLETYTTPELSAPASYWVMVSAGTCKLPSEVATVSMCANPEVIQAPADKDIAFGGSANLNVTMSPPIQSAVWYRGAQGDISNPISTQISPTVAPEGTTQYWGELFDGTCTSKTRTVTVYVSVPTISQHPAGIQVNPNQATTLSVIAKPAGVTYQWYGGVSPNGELISGATSSTLTIPGRPAGSPAINVWVKVTGPRGHTINSDTATVTVCTPASITTPPQSQSIRSGQQVTLSVDAKGTNRRYQWYNGTPPSVANPVTVNGMFVTLPVSPASTRSYWVRVMSDCGNADSAAATITVCSDPVINTHPQSRTIFSGKTATMTVDVTQSNGPAPAYQWYQGPRGGGTLIAGATDKTYTTLALNAPAQYWVQIKSGACTVDSNAATISICNYPEVINGPDDKDIAAGGSTSLSLVMSPPVQSAAWYRGVQGDKSNPVPMPVSPAVTTQYWGEVSDGTCTSKTRTVTVYVSIPSITRQPANKQLAPNETSSLSVEANTAGVTYQWYKGNGELIPGETNASLPIGPMAVGTTASYWVKVTGSRGHTVNSNTAIVTVCDPVRITSPPSSQSIRRGQTATLLVFASGTNLRHQWYAGQKGNESTPVGAVQTGTSSSLPVSPQDRAQYWVKITSDCAVASSDTVTVDVCVDPAITQQPQNQVIYSQRSATFEVGASSGTSTGLTYQWYDGQSGTGTAITGATSHRYTTPALTSDHPYWVQVTSGTCTINSSTVWATICVYPETVGLQDRTIARGGSAVLSSTLSPPAETTMWYEGARGDRRLPVAGGPSATVYPTATTQYWGEFTYGNCTTSSNTATVWLCIPTITVQPVSKKVPYGTAATLSVTATEAVSYQWYSGSTPGFGTLIDGATSSWYTTPPATSVKHYYVRVSGSCNHNPIYSKAVSVSP
jgi:YD repeat-containing protein